MPKTIAFIDPGMRLTPYLCAALSELPADMRAVFFALRPKPRSILRQCGYPLAPKRRFWGTRLSNPRPAIDRDALLARLRLHSDREAVASENAAYQALLAALQDFLDQTAPDGLFCWNGSGLAASLAAQLASHRGIPIAYGENGYLPGTMQIDPMGVNADSSFGPAHTTLEAILSHQWSRSEYEAIDSLLQQYRGGATFTPRVGRPRELRAAPLAYLEQALIDWRARGPRPRINQLIPKTPPSLPKHYVLFPLQVRQDSQLTVHSPLYGNRLDGIIARLVEALSEVAPELHLVVKLHPADRHKTDYDAVIRRFPEVFWLDGGDIRRLLPDAEAVVTINSTVGVEAMMFNRPVVVLGRAFYGFDGLVHRVTATDQLSPVLRRALNTTPDADRLRHYLAFLYFKALTRAHPNDYSRASKENFRIRLIKTLG